MRGLLLAAAVVALVSIFVLAPRCDRQVGDETDFPLFNLAAQAVCGAGILLEDLPRP